eukprot:TRINITY_DN1030_c2_g1_i1.p1 TRINITY_DN1030_c2_g1~~TRINITY_DN1030_c2_g1_i1.p1  ORF type:complete len:330 (+),score=61.83 TRINITY_DN1030_c2_g1_i1:170-1159(+)
MDSGKAVVPQVEEEQVKKAVSALLKWSHSRKQKSGKLQLLDDEDLFYVVVALKKTPESGRTNGYRIPIPHSLYPLGAGKEVCLFVKDGSKAQVVAGEATGQKAAKKLLEVEKETGVTKIIGVQKLRTHFKPFEAKRKLCGSYDLFLADDRILSLLPKLLGKSFFEKKKQPIPVALKGGAKGWANKIRQACNSTFLYLREGPCTVVRAARLSHTEEEIMENVLAVIEGVAGHVPKKWKNIQSIFLKTQESASLPLYTATPDPVALKIPAPVVSHKKLAPSTRPLQLTAPPQKKAVKAITGSTSRGVVKEKVPSRKRAAAVKIDDGDDDEE